MCSEATVPGIFGPAAQKGASGARSCRLWPWSDASRAKAAGGGSPGTAPAVRVLWRPPGEEGRARSRTGMHRTALGAQPARQHSSVVQLLPRTDGLNSKESPWAREEAAWSAIQRRGLGDPRLQVPVCSTAPGCVTRTPGEGWAAGAALPLGPGPSCWRAAPLCRRQRRVQAS